MAARTNRTEKLHLRLTAQAKRALQSAAKATHKTLGDFVLESALARADSVLAERQIFRLDAQKWAAFLTALDAPPKPRPRLAKLLSEAPAPVIELPRQPQRRDRQADLEPCH